MSAAIDCLGAGAGQRLRVGVTGAVEQLRQDPQGHGVRPVLFLAQPGEVDAAQALQLLRREGRVEHHVGEDVERGLELVAAARRGSRPRYRGSRRWTRSAPSIASSSLIFRALRFAVPSSSIAMASLAVPGLPAGSAAKPPSSTSCISTKPIPGPRDQQDLQAVGRVRRARPPGSRPGALRPPPAWRCGRRRSPQPCGPHKGCTFSV